jgi:hypothetical protein
MNTDAVVELCDRIDVQAAILAIIGGEQIDVNLYLKTSAGLREARVSKRKPPTLRCRCRVVRRSRHEHADLLANGLVFEVAKPLQRQERTEVAEAVIGAIRPPPPRLSQPTHFCGKFVFIRRAVSVLARRGGPADHLGGASSL